MNLLQGSVVRSDAGHDKGNYYIIVKAEEGYVYIADGKERKLETPKRKNIKHISMTNAKIDLNEITNKKLRKLLSVFGSEMNNNCLTSQNFKS